MCYVWLKCLTEMYALFDKIQIAHMGDNNSESIDFESIEN